MHRIMGVDYGLRRIGIAMTDLLQIAASPFCVFESVSLKKDAEKIIEIAQGNGAGEIVVGLPVNMNGTEGEMAQTARKLVEEIQAKCDIKVEIIDERLTTAQAERILVEEGNVSRGKRKGLKDKLAAALILQTYLERRAVLSVENGM